MSRVRELGRFLGPWGWLAGLAAALLLVAGVSAVWSGLWSWLPWSAESRAERAEAEAGRQTDRADVAELQAEGEGDTVRRLDTYHHQVVTVRAVADAAAAEARSAPDAATPLDSDRLDRLRRADGELCRARPGLAGCAPAPDAP